MSRSVRFVDYPLQFAQMEGEILGTIRETLRGGDLILRRQTEAFEANLAAFCGTRYAVGLSNCTDALHLALRAAGIGAGDEVITSSHTFVATAAAIVHAGARPVLVEVGADHNVDPSAIAEAITPRTRAIIPVSLNGRCCDLPRIKAIADRNDLILIEDSAQALGASVAGKKAGSWGLAGCFSFYPAKLLGAYGDAGALVTDDADLAERVRLLRNHGRTPDGRIALWSFNCRIDNLQAALLDVKLRHLPAWLARRRAIAAIYHAELSVLPMLVLPPPPVEDGERYDVYQNYEIEAPDRDGLVSHLKASGVDTLLPWGGKAVHEFADLHLGEFHLPRTERIMRSSLMLPMFPELQDDEVRYVARAVRSFYC